ncbi:MAG: NAD(P)-dependent oxidoreductase [Planctomycetes bacterium]|nr:NAD(P)-dependent oxidoreductase [Planctomycetota bacterium]
MTEKIGIIGLGLLGSAIAERLASGGVPLIGFDVSADAIDRFRSLGGEPARSASDVAASCRCLILSLPNSDVVHDVVDEIGSQLDAGMLIIDTTTGQPQQTAALGAALGRKDVEYLDATIVGSSEHVRAGQAIALVGGTAAAMRRGEGLLDRFAERVFHVGPWGSGAKMKLVVNLVMGLNRAALAEGLSLANRMELDAASTLEILQAGLSYSRVMDTKGAKMIGEQFTPPHARLSQHLKDVRLMLAEAERLGARLPLSEIHQKLLQQAESLGYGEADNSAIIKAFEARS